MSEPGGGEQQSIPEANQAPEATQKSLREETADFFRRHSTLKYGGLGVIGNAIAFSTLGGHPIEGIIGGGIGLAVVGALDYGKSQMDATLNKIKTPPIGQAR